MRMFSRINGWMKHRDEMRRVGNTDLIFFFSYSKGPRLKSTKISGFLLFFGTCYILRRNIKLELGTYCIILPISGYDRPVGYRTAPRKAHGLFAGHANL